MSASNNVLAFRAPGAPPLTPPAQMPMPPWPNRPPVKRGGKKPAGNVVPLKPKPVTQYYADESAANRRACVYHLQKLARDWGISITINPKGGAA